MSEWSTQRVEQLAPDAASLKAAQGLAKPAKWQNLGRQEGLLWGECQGSGASPYQVRVDLEDVAYKCSCPSRKLPCKHTLGLLLLLTSGIHCAEAALPAFVEEWSANRAKRASAKQPRQANADASPDPAAQAKRIEKRESRVVGGLDQLEIWLTDNVRQGLATVRSQPFSFWQQMSARLIDAQAPGLARRVRELAEAAVSSSDWQSQLLAGMARLQLLIDAYRNLERLPAAMKAEVRTQIGWTQEQDALREQEGLADHWQVLARRQIADEQLRTQQTWLYGRRSSRFALVLEFAVGSQPLPANYLVGQVLEAELVFFAGATPLRALEKNRKASTAADPSLPSGIGIAQMQGQHAARLALNPWLERWPVVLGPVRPVMIDDTLWLEDSAQRRVAVTATFRHRWHVVALAGNDEIAVFGEWDGAAFEPLSIAHGNEVFTVAQLGELPILSRVA